MLGPLTYGVLSQVTAVSSNWWESGGASGAVRVYQPKGAASLAASYFDYTGNRDAAPGTAPTWNATDGWIFTAASSQYLTTGFTPETDRTQTMLIQFTNAPSGTAILCGSGSPSGSNRFYLQSYISGSLRYCHGSFANGSASVTEGNMAVAGGQGYLNGTADGGAIGGWSGTAYEAYIGCLNNNGTPAFFTGLYVQAFAIYDNALSAAQVAAVAGAMAAL